MSPLFPSHIPLFIDLVSKFTGSYSYSGFRSCIAVNPYDTHGTAKAIHQVRFCVYWLGTVTDIGWGGVGFDYE